MVRNLCKDRNRKLLKVAEDYGLNLNHINQCMFSTRISWDLKIEYLALYSSFYIDQDPFLNYERREVKCHIWSKIADYNL